jgi:hypothetical protein
MMPGRLARLLFSRRDIAGIRRAERSADVVTAIGVEILTAQFLD